MRMSPSLCRKRKRLMLASPRRSHRLKSAHQPCPVYSALPETLALCHSAPSVFSWRWYLKWRPGPFWGVTQFPSSIETLNYKRKNSAVGTERKSSLRKPPLPPASVSPCQSRLWNVTGPSLCYVPFKQPLSVHHALGLLPSFLAHLKQTIIGICLAGSPFIFLLPFPVAFTTECLNSWQMEAAVLICPIKSVGWIFSSRRAWKWNPILTHPLSKTINISWLSRFP